MTVNAMNPFVNPKQCGVTLPKGCTDLVDVYMSDGVALGTREFVNAVFTRHREMFGKKRQHGARPIRVLAKSVYWCSFMFIRGCHLIIRGTGPPNGN
jgi:hypothetical protein